MVANRETALPVQNDIGANPTMLPHFHVAKDQDVIIAGCAFTKSVVTSDFPSVGQQVTDGDVAEKFLAHFAPQICDQPADRASQVETSSFYYKARAAYA